jgi:hypothetical protein
MISYNDEVFLESLTSLNGPCDDLHIGSLIKFLLGDNQSNYGALYSIPLGEID